MGRGGDIQPADPLGAIHLVGRETEQVDAQLLDVDGELADRLGGVAVQQHAALFTQPADLGQRLDCADLVVGQHHGNDDRIVAQGLGHLGGA